jgi:hypothetical protein
MNNDQTMLEQIRFTDEAHFHLNDYVNKQNEQERVTECPHETKETPLHPLHCNAWCPILSTGIVGPLFFDGTVTSNS